MHQSTQATTSTSASYRSTSEFGVQYYYEHPSPSPYWRCIILRLMTPMSDAADACQD